MISLPPNMQAQDELAALFAQNLTFNPEARQLSHQQVPRHVDHSSTEKIVYSISQHYNHSAHNLSPVGVSTADAYERRSSEPAPGDNLSSETILRIHGIDPQTLTPSQIQLFRIAEKPQQRRLLELWSICPPNNGGDIPALAWSSTTLEQEEQLAHLRYERQQQEQQVQDMSQMQQSLSGQWQQPEPEPYMASGYEELMRRERESQYTPATDPVYAARDFAREQQQLQMAANYGAFEQMRDSQMEAMDVM